MNLYSRTEELFLQLLYISMVSSVICHHEASPSLTQVIATTRMSNYVKTATRRKLKLIVMNYRGVGAMVKPTVSYVIICDFVAKLGPWVRDDGGAQCFQCVALDKSREEDEEYVLRTFHLRSCDCWSACLRDHPTRFLTVRCERRVEKDPVALG
jgi:hypothetical protein